MYEIGNVVKVDFTEREDEPRLIVGTIIGAYDPETGMYVIDFPAGSDDDGPFTADVHADDIVTEL